MRFYRGMTQTQIGQQLGISQMQVSRLLARALSYLRPRLFGQPEYAPANGPSAPVQPDLQARAADDGRPGRPSCLEPTAAKGCG